VSLTWLSNGRFLSAHWPKRATKLSSHKVLKDRDEGLSTNEA
jgi:hypothetical protein